MKDFKELLNVLCKYEKYLPKDLAQISNQLKEGVANLGFQKFGEIILSEDEEKKLQNFIPELLFEPLRNNYDINARATMVTAFESRGFEFDTDNDGSYFLSTEHQCLCSYFARKPYQPSGDYDDCSYYNCCTCSGDCDFPPKQCTMKKAICAEHIVKWCREHTDDVVQFLGEDIRKLHYIIRYPNERVSGFCKQMLAVLSTMVFEHFYNNNNTFKTLCNQLTPSHC